MWIKSHTIFTHLLILWSWELHRTGKDLKLMQSRWPLFKPSHYFHS